MRVEPIEVETIKRFIPRQASILNYEVRDDTIYFEYEYDKKFYSSKLAATTRGVNARKRKKL